MTDEPAPVGPRLFRGATAVRRADAQRYLWGDEQSGQVADLIYGRGERLLDVPESSLAASKRDLGEVRGGRYDLLGAWPDRRPDERRRSLDEGGVVTVGERDSLRLVHGTRRPQLVSILSSGEQLTAGTFTVRGGTKTEPEQHPGDEVVYALSGRLHVHLPVSGDWLELEPLDCAFIPGDTPHEYWSYGASATKAVFCVAPGYR